MSFDPSSSPNPQPRLFAERPVRSDFARRRRAGDRTGGGLSYATRRLITVSVLVACIGGSLFWALHRATPTRPEDIPTIRAEGSYRQRPQQPGGLEIPHQDVEVYQQLDKPGTVAATTVEHLLPPPEMPQIAAQAPSQASAVRSETVTPLAPGNRDDATPNLTMAKPLVESLTPIKPPDSDDILGEKIPPPVVPTTVMPETSTIMAQIPTTPPPAQFAAPPVTIKTAAPATSVSVNAVPQAIGAPVALVPASPSVAKMPVQSSASNPPKTMEQLLKSIDAQAKSANSVASPSIASASGYASGSSDTAIQLTSVPDQAGALLAMQQLQKKYAATLNGVTLRVVKADLGAKGVHYRVESVPISLQQARNVCAALKRQSAGCILVRS